MYLKGYRKSHQFQKGLNILFLKKCIFLPGYALRAETSDTAISELQEEAMLISPL